MLKKGGRIHRHDVVIVLHIVIDDIILPPQTPHFKRVDFHPARRAVHHRAAELAREVNILVFRVKHKAFHPAHIQKRDDFFHQVTFALARTADDGKVTGGDIAVPL